MSLIFVDRPPTDRELERLRLILSTFQDGTGMLAPSKDRPYTLPGWRDFERACALAFGGKAVESKFFVDVIFPLSPDPDLFYGVQCKMRGELRKLDRDSRIYVEVTNAARELWSYLSTKGITERNYRSQPELAGNSLIEAVEAIERSGSQQYPAGPIDLSRSYYLVLLWSERDELYQLFQLPLRLSKPNDLVWRCHVSTRRDSTETTRLVGETPEGVLYEWYGESGGQFKYYPPAGEAIWKSHRFRLEPLPGNVEQGIIAKAAAYFPELWKQVAD
jgi:hypothetical protein